MNLYNSILSGLSEFNRSGTPKLSAVFLFLLTTSWFFASGIHTENDRFDKESVLDGLEDSESTFWGKEHELIQSRLNGSDNSIALTLDACGGEADTDLIDWLREEEIPATLFLSGIWIRNHPELTAELAGDPLFSIQNHGFRHLPCSVNGETAEEIEGTASPEEAFYEIAENDRLIGEITGENPGFYRSGTAFYDEVCLEMAGRMGLIVAGYSLNGDGGAEFSSEEIKTNLLNAEAGDIVLLHMNRPDGGTLDGLKAAAPELMERGLRFIQLTDEWVQ